MEPKDFTEPPSRRRKIRNPPLSRQDSEGLSFSPPRNPFIDPSVVSEVTIVIDHAKLTDIVAREIAMRIGWTGPLEGCVSVSPIDDKPGSAWSVRFGRQRG